MNALNLAPEERLLNKPFTHPAYTQVEARLLRYMLMCVCHSLQGEPCESGLSVKETLESDGRYHRTILLQSEVLKTRASFVIVGFFGQKSFDANTQDVDSRDAMLFDEMGQNLGLLSYSSLELTNGDYGNCVVFSDETAKNHWGSSVVHDAAVKELSPRFYHSVRLYNAKLEAPLQEGYKLSLQQVRYFDYSTNPPWIAVRKLID